MLNLFKRRLYFGGARYFRFWARIKLRRWAPTVIVVTGSAGKTTLLHLIEAQLGREAKYSHHANSAYGIPFDILGLKGVTTSRFNWIGLFLKAPFTVLSDVPKARLYIAEADADRPGEARFLGQLLHPKVTLWVNSLHTHTTAFDSLVSSGKFRSVEEAVAYEYGHLLAATSDLVVMDGDIELMVKQKSRTTAKVVEVRLSELKEYTLKVDKTRFRFDKRQYTLPAAVPKATYYQVAMTDAVLSYLNATPDLVYERFELPPGRSSLFTGVKGTTLIDSTYNNSNIDSLGAIIEMFDIYPAHKKWLVIGDMLEQGKDEAREHQKVANMLASTHFDKILFVGKRVRAHTVPALSASLKERTKILVFKSPTEVKEYLQAELSGQETVLFKGAGFLEGVVESLLVNKADAAKLVRRERIYQKKRAAWGM